MKPLIATSAAFVLLIFTGLFSPVYAADPEGPVSVLARSGKILFDKYCSSCHGLDGRGHGPVAPALVKAPADLTLIARRRPAKVKWPEIAEFIDGRTYLEAHGKRDMPVWGQQFRTTIPEDEFREESVRGDLAALIEYLRSIQVE